MRLMGIKITRKKAEDRNLASSLMKCSSFIVKSFAYKCIGYIYEHPAYVPLHLLPSSRGVALKARARTSLDISIDRDNNIPCHGIIIEEIKLDDAPQLQLMSEFCIDMFYNKDVDKESETLISR